MKNTRTTPRGRGILIFGLTVLLAAVLVLLTMWLRPLMPSAQRRQEALGRTMVTEESLQELVTKEAQILKAQEEAAIRSYVTGAIHEQMDAMSQEEFKALAGDYIKTTLRKKLESYRLPESIREGIGGTVDRWLDSPSSDWLFENEVTQSVTHRTVDWCVRYAVEDVQPGGSWEALVEDVVADVKAAPLHRVGFSPIRVPGVHPGITPLRSVSYYDYTSKTFLGIPYDMEVHGWNEEAIGSLTQFYCTKNDVLDLPHVMERVKALDYHDIVDRAIPSALGEELNLRWQQIMEDLQAGLREWLPFLYR